MTTIVAILKITVTALAATEIAVLSAATALASLAQTGRVILAENVVKDFVLVTTVFDHATTTSAHETMVFGHTTKEMTISVRIPKMS